MLIFYTLGSSSICIFIFFWLLHFEIPKPVTNDALNYWAIFFVFIVNVTSMCQTKKIVTCGVSKIYEWIFRDTYRWVKLSKGVIDDG